MADASTDEKATSPDEPNTGPADRPADETTGKRVSRGRGLLRSRRAAGKATGTEGGTAPSETTASSETTATDTTATDDDAPTDGAVAGEAADAGVERNDETEKVSTTKSGSTTKPNKAAADGAAGAGKAGTGTSGATTKAGKSGRKSAEKGPRISAGRLARIITTLAVAAVLLAVIVLVELIRGSGDSDRVVAQEDRREAARQAAETTVPRLYSYDYRKIDADLAEQSRVTTGEINEAIQKTTAPALKQLAPRTTSVVQAVVLSSAATEVVGEDVKVLVFMNQAVNNNLLSAPRLDRSRVLATMRLVDGQWKVARIEPL